MLIAYHISVYSSSLITSGTSSWINIKLAILSLPVAMILIYNTGCLNFKYSGISLHPFFRSYKYERWWCQSFALALSLRRLKASCAGRHLLSKKPRGTKKVIFWDLWVSSLAGWQLIHKTRKAHSHSVRVSL